MEQMLLEALINQILSNPESAQEILSMLIESGQVEQVSGSVHVIIMKKN